MDTKYRKIDFLTSAAKCFKFCQGKSRILLFAFFAGAYILRFTMRAAIEILLLMIIVTVDTKQLSCSNNGRTFIATEGILE